MNQNLTEIAFVLDRSGSMAALADEAIGAFNSFLNDQKKQPGECRFTLAIFDHEYRLEHDGKNVQEAPELNRDTYKPLMRTLNVILVSASDASWPGTRAQG